jgi:hypothetical protein
MSHASQINAISRFEFKTGQVKKANKRPVIGQNIRNYKKRAFQTPQMNTGTVQWAFNANL